MIRNSYMELKASRSKLEVRRNVAIEEIDQEDYDQEDQQYIEVHYIKGYKEREHKHLLSQYKKQNKSPLTIIIKNQTRQIITHITSSSHYNTLITYEAETFEKKTLGKF